VSYTPKQPNLGKGAARVSGINNVTHNAKKKNQKRRRKGGAK
jgi:hypothetical protein